MSAPREIAIELFARVPTALSLLESIRALGEVYPYVSFGALWPPAVVRAFAEIAAVEVSEHPWEKEADGRESRIVVCCYPGGLSTGVVITIQGCEYRGAIVPPRPAEVSQ